MHKNLKNALLIVLLLITTSAVSFVCAYFYFQKNAASNLLSPLANFTQNNKQKDLPLLKYSFANLAQQDFTASAPITIKQLLNHDINKDIYTLLFTYQSQGKTISGALNLKLDPETQSTKPAILMLRGYVSPEIYTTGIGTKNVATVLAENNYLTLAPDFLGFGDSDPEPTDTWEARFIKVVNVVDLLKTIQQFPEIDLSPIAELAGQTVTIDTSKIGIWGHSNGGQIAVSMLEVLGTNLPTALWAPVLVPFPYSILYFSDEYADEGKETRQYVALFEEDYDVFDFSLTQHLDRLNGPIQIQHGTNDDSALISWTTEFLTKIDLENERRATASSQAATIDIDFYQYAGADHNLQPNWNQAVQKDLNFFNKNLLATE